MRPLRILSLLALLLILPLSGASAATNWIANMNGASEVPANASPATGVFQASLNDAHDRMDFSLSYANLTGSMLFAHIHRAAVGVNGPIVYFLSASAQPSPFSGCADPAPAGPPGDCAFNPADFADLQGSNMYANLHTGTFPGGEIRGQILAAVAVTPSTWGRMKNLFR